jgi:hypothetical protein
VDILERAAVADPKGIRTIGVLTKPDLIGPGGEDEVLAVLHNVRKPLKLGCGTGGGGGGSCGERGRREDEKEERERVKRVRHRPRVQAGWARAEIEIE